MFILLRLTKINVYYNEQRLQRLQRTVYCNQFSNRYMYIYQPFQLYHLYIFTTKFHSKFQEKNTWKLFFSALLGCVLLYFKRNDNYFLSRESFFWLLENEKY